MGVLYPSNTSATPTGSSNNLAPSASASLNDPSGPTGQLELPLTAEQGPSASPLSSQPGSPGNHLADTSATSALAVSIDLHLAVSESKNPLLCQVIKEGLMKIALFKFFLDQSLLPPILQLEHLAIQTELTAHLLLTTDITLSPIVNISSLFSVGHRVAGIS